MESVKQKAAQSIIWSIIQRFGYMAISFISGIVLARLLMPEDYGAIGMLSIFMIVAQGFLDGGFDTALLQKKRPTQQDYSTIFFWNLALSSFLYACLYFAAPYVASYYNMPTLCSVLRVQALVLIVYSLTLVQSSILKKQFKFKKIAVVQIISSSIALIVTILMAYKGYGVWSLVTQNLLITVLPTIIYLLTDKWLPSFTFSKDSFKELFSFGIFMLLARITNDICNNIQGLLIGRFYNASTMGYFSKAMSTEKLASTSISQALNLVSFPLYSEFQDDLKKLTEVIGKLTRTIAYLTFPLVSLLILLAKPIFIILYSERWLDSIPFFQILCLMGLVACLQSVNSQAIAAIGKSKQLFGWTLLIRLSGLMFLIGGFLINGIWGLLWGIVFQEWYVYLFNSILVAKYIGYTVKKMLTDIAPMIILSVLGLVSSYFLGSIISNNLYIAGAIKLVCFLAIYIILSKLFKIKELGDIILLLKKCRKKNK